MADLFENTLLIFKSDYMNQRKPVLLKLLDHGFQIQGRRTLLFTPEHAAEFYKDLAEEETFMLQVILLSKGISEAFILTKQNAVADLITNLICYFGTSMEMERNVHVTQRVEDVQREIQFIFPNYIHEPVPFFERSRFCAKPLMPSLINELYEITQAADAVKDNPHWRVKLAEWLMLTNKTLPRISNQCSTNPTTRHEDKGEQVTLLTDKKPYDDKGSLHREGSPSISFSSGGSSAIMSSSSCMSCPCFDGTNVCKEPPPSELTKEEFLQMIKNKTQEPPKLEEEPPREHGEGLNWIEVTSDQCSEEEKHVMLLDEHELEVEMQFAEQQSNQGDIAIAVEEYDTPRV